MNSLPQDVDEELFQTITGGRPFGKDAIHFLKLARVIAEQGITAPAPWTHTTTKQATRILYSPRSDWFREVTGLLCGPYAPQGLQFLYETRILGLLLPEVHEMVGFAETSKYHHKDLWEHTKQVVDQAEPTPLIRWAALLHDAGKIWTRTYSGHKEVHFFQHDELGAILVEGIGARFQMEPGFQEQLAFLVRHHLRPNAYESKWSDSAVRRLVKEMGKMLPSLLLLSKADMTSGIAKKRRQAEKLSQELQERIQHIIEVDSVIPPLPKGIGSEIIRAFDCPPGPRIGRIKLYLEQQIEAGLLEPHQDNIYYITQLKALPQLPA